MCRFIIIAFVLAVFTASASESLDSLFNRLSSMKGASASQIDFTGGFAKNGPGFAMMRGEGKGHTKGTKIAVPQVDVDFAYGVLGVIDEKGAWGDDYYKTVAGTQTVYSIYFNEKTDSLYMVRPISTTSLRCLSTGLSAVDMMPPTPCRLSMTFR